MSLKEYAAKRNFKSTPEPKGGGHEGEQNLRFVVQMHDATRLHYDLRIEWAGTMKSWAVPKGPSLNPTDQRLAVFVEDHPIEYASFEGVIPKGNYGAGTVMVWDAGTVQERGSSTWLESEEAFQVALEKGHITFILNGSKLKGEFALVRINDDPKNWLLLKKRDQFARYIDITQQNRSVKTGRSMEEIKGQSEEAGDIWLPGKGPNQEVTRVDFFANAPLDTSQPLRTPGPGSEIIHGEVKAAKMPVTVPKVMQAKQFPNIFQENGWTYEAVPYGYRALIVKRGKTCKVFSKRGMDKTASWFGFKDKLEHLADCILDGYITSNPFQQTEEETIAQIRRKDGSTAFLPIDILFFDGMDYRATNLKKRLELLDSLFPDPSNPRKDNVEQLTDSIAHYSSILARDLGSHYKPGVQDCWLEVSPKSNVETYATDLPANPSPGSGWQTAVAPKSGTRIGPGSILFSNLDRPWWPGGLTKGDIVWYYKQVANVILPYLLNTPMSLNRHPYGIHGESFFQKDVGGFLPAWLHTTQIKSASKTIQYALCQNEAALLYLINLGCIELNPWFSRIDNLEHPWYVAIDLDPPQQTMEEITTVAQTIKSILDQCNVRSFCKTSGSRGLHICLPTDRSQTFDQTRAFVLSVCKLTEQKHPQICTTERVPSRRNGKMYLDFLQNRRGQTLASVYCVRPRDIPSVSTPLDWDEVNGSLDPGRFQPSTMEARLADKGDLWSGMLDPAPALPEPI